MPRKIKIFKLKINNEKTLKLFVKILTEIVLNDPKSAYFCARKAYKTMAFLSPQNSLKNPFKSFREHMDEIIFRFTEDVFGLLYSPYLSHQRQLMGFITFTGLLFNKHLVNENFIYSLLQIIMEHGTNFFYQLTLENLMKDRMLMEEGSLDKNVPFSWLCEMKLSVPNVQWMMSV